MKAKRILLYGLVILIIVFIGLQLMKYEMYASFVRAAMMVMLTALYCQLALPKKTYFFLFLITFSVADILGLSYWFITIDPKTEIDYAYYICNGLYILSYFFLIIKVLKSMNIRDVITKLPAHIVILVVLDIFCVTIVTDTARSELSVYQYGLEYLYNAVVMSLLTLAVINYIHKVDKNAMNLLVGSIFIVFSEIIQMAYFYILEINVLNVMSSLFLVIAFLFFYLHATLKDEVEYKTFQEHLET